MITVNEALNEQIEILERRLNYLEEMYKYFKDMDDLAMQKETSSEVTETLIQLIKIKGIKEEIKKECS